MKMKMVMWLLTGSLGLASAGCAGIDQLGKVEAWEKGQLAKRQMALESDPLDTRLSQQIYRFKEGTSGGYGVGGGGCGCN